MKLSIITINKNNEAGLSLTTNSVIIQSFRDFEYIVIDGESSDNSIDILEKSSKLITYWVSEPDNGIYSAMNKGLLKATGEYILFLNSGDYFYNSAVLENIFKFSFTEDLIVGSVILDGRGKKEIFEIPEIDKLSFRYFMESTLPHPGTLINRGLFDKVGNFNETNLIASDWEFFLLAIFKHGATLRKIPEIISVFDWNGISSLPENNELVKKERNDILHSHFSMFLPDYIYLDQLEMTNKDLEKKVKKSFYQLITKRIMRIKGKSFE
jgi:glycosyltransferase involved in cell wall biosynthesis